MTAFPSASYAQVRSACGAMLFSGDDAKKSISVLSGGEKSRVLLAKILLTPANLLLLDEPTHHLDMESIVALMGAIENFPGAVVIVSHDENILKKLNVHKLIICHQGRQDVFLGDYTNFLEKRGWEEEGEMRTTAKTKQSKTARKSLQTLRSIKKNMEKTEKRIEKSEREKNKLEAAMMNDVAEWDAQKLSHQYGELSKEIDNLYDQLQKLHDDEQEIKNR